MSKPLRITRWITGMLIVALGATSAWAQPPAASSGSAKSKASTAGKPSRPPKKKGKATREQEAEGTEAANRFNEDPVIKSQYHQNGEPLEVDPD